MRAALIHNGGGGSASQEDLDAACASLGQSFALETYLVGENASPVELARQAVRDGAELLVASGGDGTVSAVASAIIGRLDVPLGILPRGTANSIATHLGIPSDLEGACEVIRAGHERIIDTASVNGRPMVLMATLGLHAETITDADPEAKKKFGVLAYVVEAVGKMLDDSLFDVTLESAGQRVSLRTSAVTVANVAPPSSLFAHGPAKVDDHDGLLDVTLIALDGVADALATSIHLATCAVAGWPAARDNIAFFRTAELSVSTSEPRRLMIDGEDAGTSPFTVRCVPRSLRVRVPRPEDEHV